MSNPEIKNPLIIRILIVEDEYILALDLKENLVALGYQVVGIAHSGESAIVQAAELRPDIVLMDIRLPGQIDGIEAAENIWLDLQIPIIYVSGYSDRNTVERATKTFPFGYILKPVSERELHVAIQTAIHQYDREQFLHTILNSMGDGVIVVDTNYRLKYLNPVAESLTGLQLETVRDQDVTVLMTFIDESNHCPIEHPVVAAIAQDTTVYLQNRILLVTQSGTTVPIADSATPLKDRHGTTVGAVTVIRDDTRRRLLAERDLARERSQLLEQQMSELKRLDTLKDDFLATTSHELRTPLSNIRMAITVLQDLLTSQGNTAMEELPNGPTIDRYLTILREQCDQELRLVNDLLDMRSMQADAYPLELTEIHLQDWLPAIVESFQTRAILQEQDLEILLLPELPPIVADQSSLTRIISELLNNACKYTPRNGQIQIIVQRIDPIAAVANPMPALSLPEKATLAYFQIMIRNSGVEIAPAELTKIFDPFYRIPNNNPWKQRGTGLGLALIKKLVEYLQGTIAVTNEQNWINFIVQLPLDIGLVTSSTIRS